jgi:Isoprenylcysteine carboxyl methyltransferase (ICMT) family
MNNQSPESKQSRLQVGSIGIVTTLVYLWLAVLGAGGFAAFFSHPARTILAVASMAMASAAFFSDCKSELRRTRGPFQSLDLPASPGEWPPERVLAGIRGATGVVGSRRRNRSLAWSLLLSGGWRVADLAHLRSGPPVQRIVAIQPGHELVTDGIYRVIRHPSYLGMIILMLGWALAFRSGLGVILAALIVPPLLARIRSEETLLRSQFGAEYDAYRRRTSRLIPGIY